MGDAPTPRVAADGDVLNVLAAIVSERLSADGFAPIDALRLDRALARRHRHPNTSRWRDLGGGRWHHDAPDGSQCSYVRQVGELTAELHVHRTGATWLVYSGATDPETDSPMDGLVVHHSAPVARDKVADPDAAWSWLDRRVAAGLPEVSG